MRVTRQESPNAAWDAFVERASDASVFHLSAWRIVLARVYGHETFYLIAQDGERTAGVLPLIRIDSSLFGRALVSMPFADYGGISSDGDDRAATGLLDEALRLGESLSVDYVQLRQPPGAALDEAIHPRLSTFSGKVTMLLDLRSDPEEMWKSLPSERRNRVRKARKQGLTARWAGADELDSFYDVFSANMRDLGSPVHSRALFEQTLLLLGDRARLLLVERGDQVLGAAVCLFFRETLLVPWVSSRREAFRLYPNMLLYWTAIEHGCTHGYRRLDFGRSTRGAGTYEFKRQWGARETPLAWQSVGFRGKAAPGFAEPGLKERLMVSCWKRLPLSVTRYVGPRLRGSIPA